jgi:hypothetical protein
MYVQLARQQGREFRRGQLVVQYLSEIASGLTTCVARHHAQRGRGRSAISGGLPFDLGSVFIGLMHETRVINTLRGYQDPRCRLRE